MDTNPVSSEDAGHVEGLAPGLEVVSDAIHRRARTTRLRRGLIAAVLTVAGLTLLFEIGLRLSGQRQAHFEATVNKTNQRWVDLTTAGLFEELADPVRRYAMRPGAEATVDDWSFRVTSHRSRGAEFPTEKPAGEKRILCLGDSFAFGLWCAEDETLVGHLARRANEREDELGGVDHWRAINLGVPGYHAGQQLIAFEADGLALDPDVVLLYFNTNDIEQEGFYFDASMGVLRRDLLPLPVQLKRWLWSSHAYGWIVTRFRRMVEAGEIPAHMNPAVPYAFVRADNQAATRAAVARMAQLCAERDIPFFMVDQPHLTWQGELLDPNWPMLPLIQWAAALREELGIPGVSLLGLFRGYADGRDRLAEGAAPDFLLDSFVADVGIEAWVAWARARAISSGDPWDTLSTAERMQLFEGYPGEIPTTPDFHLNGAGYGHLARIAYRELQREGMLP